MLGSYADTLLCDKLKGILDPDTEYTPETGVQVLSASPEFKLMDGVAWFFDQVPLPGPTNAAWGELAWTEEKLITRINQFADTGTHAQGVVETCCRNVYLNYIDHPERDTTILQNLISIMTAA